MRTPPGPFRTERSTHACDATAPIPPGRCERSPAAGIERSLGCYPRAKSRTPGGGRHERACLPCRCTSSTFTPCRLPTRPDGTAKRPWNGRCQRDVQDQDGPLRGPFRGVYPTPGDRSRGRREATAGGRAFARPPPGRPPPPASAAWPTWPEGSHTRLRPHLGVSGRGLALIVVEVEGNAARLRHREFVPLHPERPTPPCVSTPKGTQRGA